MRCRHETGAPVSCGRRGAPEARNPAGEPGWIAPTLSPRAPPSVRLARRVALLIALAGPLAGCGGEAPPLESLAEAGPAALARLTVRVDSADGRAYFFGDGRGTFFYDALAGPQTDPAMGLVAGGFRMVDGWRWALERDSADVLLGPEDLARAIVRPDLVARSYAEADTTGLIGQIIRAIQGPELKRLTEVVTLAEGALLVSVPDSIGTVALLPAFSDRGARADYQVRAEGDVLLVARTNYLERRPGSPRPVWLAVAASGGQARAGEEAPLEGLGARDRGLAPGRVAFPTPGAAAFAAGHTPEAAAAAARRALERRDDLLEARRQRLVAALGGNNLETEDEGFNRALLWARLSLEQLIVEDSTGIDLAPGIPGARAQPGWSTMQAFEGAFLATGQWERAAALLKRYARAQLFDQRITTFGRAPSRFEDGQPRYQTADAAAVLVGALGDYLRTTGADSLVLGNRRLFWTNPVYVQRGYDDPRQLRTPGGFIRSGPGETWVQPAPGRREATARGPEAVEVQARYYANLGTMERLATIMGVRRQAEAYRDTAAAFERRFERAFVQERNGDVVLADSRDAAGRPSPALRPSALYALRRFDLGAETERSALRHLAETLVYPHGVSTLVQGDSAFHPYLNEPEFYEPAAARYEGTVWTALTGPLVSLLVEHGAEGLAYEQTEVLERLLLEQGVVGAVAENLDAHPRAEGEAPEAGGAPVQPWTLAEFVRNAFEDYAGIRYAEGHEVVLEPHLPAGWGETRARFRLGAGFVRATIRQSEGELSVGIATEGRLPRGARLRVRGLGREKALPLVREQERALVPVDTASVTLTASAVTVDGQDVEADTSYAAPEVGFWDGFAWARPRLLREYPVMRLVRRARRLEPRQVARTNPTALPILSRTDPAGDDWGATATYTYPPGFPEGILDATYLEIARDDSTLYFRVEFTNLADEAELGYQPTLVALAFDTEEGGQREVGRNANYRLAPTAGYEHIVFVGDGIRVEDARGRVLGEVARAEGLVSAEEGLLQFALPSFVLPVPRRGAGVTLLVGARDAAEPMTFRTVRAQADGDHGGGKLNRRDPNIYDVLNATVER